MGWRASETVPAHSTAGTRSQRKEFWTVTHNQSIASPIFLHLKGKAGICANSSSSKPRNSLRVWCCERGMYATKTICSTSWPFFSELFDEVRHRQVLLKSKTRKWPAGDVCSRANYMNSLEAAWCCYYGSNLRHPESQFFQIKHKEIMFGGAEKEHRNISEAILILNKRRANPIPNWKSKCWCNWTK